MRFSLGMSTPARRAIAIPSVFRRSCTESSGFPARACVPGVHPAFTGCDSAPVLFMPLDLFSALTLLVARVDADHHDAAVTTDHAAVLADPLHTRADLHGFPLLVYLTCNGT